MGIENKLSVEKMDSINNLSASKLKTWASQVVLVVKKMPANAGCERGRFDPWVGKVPWRRAWQPTLVSLPGESHGQRSLSGYSPWGCKELDMTEVA